jgi:tellurite resistance-related uncharacterized protein
MKHLKLSIPFVLTVIFLSSMPIFAQKMNPEEIIAKHLDSIGTIEKRSVIKNQMVLGDAKFAAKGNGLSASGKIVIFSANNKSLWGMNFNSNEYPVDRYSYDGKNTKIGYIRPGVRSTLGGFILSYTELLREGLLGGTLTSSWVLLNNESGKAKLSFDGTKEISEKEVYVLSYSPKKGSDLSIKMYFDKQTYQHVRTEYNRVISARQGATIDTSAGQGQESYQLIEKFSDFKKAGDLTLPTKYTISYEFTTNALIRSRENTTRQLEWTFNISDFSYNQQLDDTTFDIDAK